MVGLLVIALVIVGVLMYMGIIPNPFAKRKPVNATANTATLSAATANTAPVGTAAAGSRVASSTEEDVEEDLEADEEDYEEVDPESEGFQMPTVAAEPISSEESTLVNLQPLSIKDAGFSGPYPNGEFDAETATMNALKAGFRFLTLNIDSMTSAKAGFEEPGVPTLLIRSSSGALMSTNSGSISKVAQTIANAGFRPEIPHNTQPIILYLHVQRTPNRVQNPSDYIKFLSKIAKALNPLAPVHLGLNPLGNFTRQKMESSLLTTPIKSLQGHVIIMCNADTSLFRKKSTPSSRFNPDEDLDFWVNMRVYLENEADKNGVTQLPPAEGVANAVLVDTRRVLALSQEKKDQFAEKGKNRFVISMWNSPANPTTSQIQTAINVLGINSIPVDIFSVDTASILDLASEYSNMPFHPKPSALRSSS